MILASHKNKLVNHPSYAKILHQYNERLGTDGKVNDKKFYEEVILKEIPDYHLQSWYQFLKRFKTEHGIIEAQPTKNIAQSKQESEVNVATTMLSNKDATSKGIALALNIAVDRLQQIMENPQLMTPKEAIDLLFKAMKSQDSRIHAIGKVREDNREEEKLSRAFSDNAYGE